MKLRKILLSSVLISSLVLPSTVFAEEAVEAAEEEMIELEISGQFKNETAIFTKSTSKYNNAANRVGQDHSAGDLMKFENSLNLFINAELTEDVSAHMQLNFVNDAKGIKGYENHRLNTQNDYLRELYIDTVVKDWDIRLGKQQVVWGTADGVKFLDIINPTDYREWGQNTMEDSRIPLWILSAETAIGDGDASIQLLWVPDLEINQIPGIHNPQTGDAGQPFLSLGMDSIVGSYNGFVNIGNDMGRTAGVFGGLLNMGGLGGLTGPTMMSNMTVSQFTSMNMAGLQGAAPIIMGQIADTTAINGMNQTENTALFGAVFAPMMGNLITQGGTNPNGTGNNVLSAAANGAGSSLLPAFQTYMGQLMGARAAGSGMDFNQNGTIEPAAGELTSAQVDYSLTALCKMMTGQLKQNFAGAGVNVANDAVMAGVLSQQLQGLSQLPQYAGINTTITAADIANHTQYIAYNPALTPAQQASADKVSTAVRFISFEGMKATSFQDGSTNQFSGTLNTQNPSSVFDFMGDTTFATFNDFQGMKTKYRRDHVSEKMKNHNLGFRYKDSTENGTNYSFNYYYHWDNNPTIDMHWEDSVTGQKLTPTYTDVPTGQPGQTVKTVSLAGKTAGAPATLVFQENMHRVHSIGGSFDTTIDTDFAPLVLRGEFVYDKGTKQVVMDKGLLAIGDLVGSMKSEDADMVKFVLGLDVTVMTNLFVSLQYMQMTNLDYIDTNSAYSNSANTYKKYSANQATMHASNGFAGAEEHQTGFTLFLSKPFLENDALRVNNIFLYENEEAGIWNRFDLEYSWSDDIILTAEYNFYGGDDNAVFGQFVEQSNAQVGFKYIF